jgi:uncharacterized repeat protein (TIGR03803 family)
MPTRNNPIALVIALAVTGFLVTAASIKAVGQEQVLHAFSGRDGGLSYSSLIFDTAGNLYGTTEGGGHYARPCPSYGCGTVFKLTPGTNGWTETVLHRFDVADGDVPEAGMIFDAAGNLYGTTYSGGRKGYGTVFKLTPGANGRWTERVLHSFDGHYPNHGYGPQGGVIFDATGNLYGTTTYGGRHGQHSGTVFELTPGVNGNWTARVLHNFYAQASMPNAGLVMDAAGNLYGTASTGGRITPACPAGCGAVFKLTPGMNGKWTYAEYPFDSTDGATPNGGLILDAAGNLYGATAQGGTAGSGVVFKLVPSTDDKWTEIVLHSFSGNDGSTPYGNLIFDAAGDLYGTTVSGGSFGFGTAFELVPSANGTWTETVLYDFGEVNGGEDGAAPYAGVILDTAGNLYGTTFAGGNESDCSPYGGCGVVFEIIP